MRLSQALSYHAKTPVDGLTSSNVWVTDIAKVHLATFDRFITERSFGQKKRIITSPQGLETFGKYPVIRLPGGFIYMVSAYNPDIAGHTVYGHTYLLQEAPYQMGLYLPSANVAASGMPIDLQPSKVGTVYGDMERLGGSGTREFESTDYTTVVITLPHNTKVETNMSLKVGSSWYEVSEVWETMRVVQVKAEERTKTV